MKKLSYLDFPIKKSKYSKLLITNWLGGFFIYELMQFIPSIFIILLTVILAIISIFFIVNKLHKNNIFICKVIKYLSKICLVTEQYLCLLETIWLFIDYHQYIYKENKVGYKNLSYENENTVDEPLIHSIFDHINYKNYFKW